MNTVITLIYAILMVFAWFMGLITGLGLKRE
jgi:hypothetical protein